MTDKEENKDKEEQEEKKAKTRGDPIATLE